MSSLHLKIHLLILMLLFSAELYADYDITVNIDGEQYYSNASGSSNNKAVSVENDGSISISYNRSHRRAGHHFTQTPRYGAKSKSSRKYDRLIAQAANKHRLDPKLVHAVIQTESAYNEKAISSAGAAGLMQLMPGTAQRYGVTDRFDPSQNIEGGTRYLKHLVELFDTNLDLALAAYNAGENAVIRHNYRIPPYAETRNYVKDVRSLHKGRKPRGKANPFVSWSDGDFVSEFDYP